MNGVNGATGTSRPLAKPKFSAQIKELLGLAKKLLSHENEIGDLDQILDEKRGLEEKLQSKDQELITKGEEIVSLRLSKESEIEKLRFDKDKEITTLQSAKDTLFREFQGKYKTWDTRTTKQTELEGEVAELNQKLSRTSEKADSSERNLAELQQQSLEHQNALADTENELRIAKRDLSSRDRELEGTVLELESWKSILEEERRELGLVELDLDNLEANFSDFAKRCHELARGFFLTRLPENEDLTWDNVSTELHQSNFIKAAPKKVPMSNSVPSQYLRMATAEKIIASKVYTNIFQRYYLPESSAVRDEIDKVLDQLYKDSHRGEAIFRLRLLSAYKPEDEQRRIASVVHSTVEEVVSILSPLLFTLNAREGFQSGLGELLREAVKLWRHVQRSAERGLAEIESGQEWGAYEDYDSAMRLSAEQAVLVPDSPDAILSLFPQVSIGGEVVFQGYALWSSQNTVVAANMEYNQSKPRNPRAGSTGSTRGGIMRWGSDRRKLSLSGGRAEDMPTSPRTPGNQSFLDHAQSRKMSLPGARLEEPGGSPGGK